MVFGGEDNFERFKKDLTHQREILANTTRYKIDNLKFRNKKY